MRRGGARAWRATILRAEGITPSMGEQHGAPGWFARERAHPVAEEADTPPALSAAAAGSIPSPADGEARVVVSVIVPPFSIVQIERSLKRSEA